jgi:hypothetical protein
LFEFSGDISAIYSVENVYFEVGGRIGAGMASFSYDSPLYLFGDEIRGDGIGTFFIAAPIGVQVDLGTITIESQISPTLSFHDPETEIGFDNDIVFTKWSLPIAFGIGVNF